MRNTIHLFILSSIILLTTAYGGYAQQLMTGSDGTLYFRTLDGQRLVTNNAALYYYSKHSTVTNFHLLDKEGTLYGKVYGSGNGINFGLTDGDGQWSYKAVKDNHTAFYINNSEKMRIKSNGYVGVGTNTPGAKLHAKGYVRASNSTNLGEYTEIGHGGSNAFVNTVGDGNLEFRHDNNTKMAVTSAGRVTIPATTDASGSVGTGVLEIGNKLRLDGDEIITNSNSTMYLQNGNNGDLRVDGSTFMVDASTNRVGINTISPDNALDVLGTIRSNEVKVELGWSDYVFNEEYKVPTLEEEEKHIKENKHLLGFESEKEMNGEIQLGDVSRRQQAKIEEMMLHLIEINKTVKQMENKISQLEQENTQLKEQVSEKGK